MLKLSTYRLILTGLLLFAVVSSVFASDDDIARNWSANYVTLHSAQKDVVRYSQSQRGNIRSRSEVIREVKKRYNAEILKVALDERQQLYRVRVLMPNGKVRNLKINAKR